MLYKVVLTFESVDKILKCGYSNESYQVVLATELYFTCTACYTKCFLLEFVDEILKCDHSNESY